MTPVQSFVIAIVNVFFSSADPNLFGSRKRRKKLEAEARKAKRYAQEYDTKIEQVEAQNPFESAAAKSAMKSATLKTKQIQNRYLNQLGGSASPEAVIASQGQTQSALGDAMGNIATGAEAMKKQELSQLENRKAGMLGQSLALGQAAANEIGSGWRDFYGTMINPLAGGIKGGIQGSQG